MFRSLCAAFFVIALAAASCSSDVTDGAGGSAAGEAGLAAGQPGAAGDGDEGGSPAQAGGIGGSVVAGAAGAPEQAGAPATSTAGVGADAGAPSSGGAAGSTGGTGDPGGAGDVGGAGNVGGAGDAGEATCGELIVNAGCADADAETQDYQSGEFQGCVHFRDSEQGWVSYDGFGGFAYDLDSGLAWVIRTPMTMNRAQVSAFCADFQFAGSSDWRLPTIDEVRVFNAGCAPTASDGSCELSAPGCLTQDCGTGPKCQSCVAHQGPYGVSKDYCPADAPFCISIATSSNCSDCGMDADWRNGPINGNFFAAGAASLTFPVCVSEAVERAVPCAP